jgi:hypothetical protein
MKGAALCRKTTKKKKKNERWSLFLTATAASAVL